MNEVFCTLFAVVCASTYTRKTSTALNSSCWWWEKTLSKELV